MLAQSSRGSPVLLPPRGPLCQHGLPPHFSYRVPWGTPGTAVSCWLLSPWDPRPAVSSVLSSPVLGHLPLPWTSTFQDRVTKTAGLSTGFVFYLACPVLKIYFFGLPWWCSGLRIQLPTPGTQVQSLGREGSTCHGALSPHSRAHELQLLNLRDLEPVLCDKRCQRNEKPLHCNEEWHLLAATRESPGVATEIQCNQNQINKLLKLQKSKKYILLNINDFEGGMKSFPHVPWKPLVVSSSAYFAHFPSRLASPGFWKTPLEEDMPGVWSIRGQHLDRTDYWLPCHIFLTFRMGVWREMTAFLWMPLEGQSYLPVENKNLSRICIRLNCMKLLILSWFCRPKDGNFTQFSWFTGSRLSH